MASQHHRNGRVIPLQHLISAAILALVHTSSITAYQDSDFLIGQTLPGHSRSYPTYTSVDDDDAFLSFDDDDDEALFESRTALRRNPSGLKEFLVSLFENDLGLPPIAVTFGAATLLSLLQQKITGSFHRRRPRESGDRYGGSTSRGRQKGTDDSTTKPNWQELYEATVSQLEVIKSDLQSQVTRSEDRATYWESIATTSEEELKKLQAEIASIKEGGDQVTAETTELEKDLRLELESAKEEIRQITASSGEEKQALQIEINRTQELIGQMESEYETMKSRLRTELETAFDERKLLETRAAELQSTLQKQMEESQERAAYWEARCNQQVTQHSEHISKLCEEMKNIMVEEKELLKKEFDTETELLRQRLMSGPPKTDE